MYLSIIFLIEKFLKGKGLYLDINKNYFYNI